MAATAQVMFYLVKPEIETFIDPESYLCGLDNIQFVYTTQAMLTYRHPYVFCSSDAFCGSRPSAEINRHHGDHHLLG